MESRAETLHGKLTRRLRFGWNEEDFLYNLLKRRSTHIQKNRRGAGKCLRGAVDKVLRSSPLYAHYRTLSLIKYAVEKGQGRVMMQKVGGMHTQTQFRKMDGSAFAHPVGCPSF